MAPYTSSELAARIKELPRFPLALAHTRGKTR